jgi:hypothetical protein
MNKVFNNYKLLMQGTLTKGKDSVQLTSYYYKHKQYVTNTKTTVHNHLFLEDKLYLI